MVRSRERLGGLLRFYHREARRVQKHKRTQDRRAGAVSIVINPWRAPDLGVGGDVGDSSSPYAQGKHSPARGCHAPERKPGSRPGPHLGPERASPLRRGSLGLDSRSSRDESANKRRNHAGMVPADRRLVKFGARG